MSFFFAIGLEQQFVKGSWHAARRRLRGVRRCGGLGLVGRPEAAAGDFEHFNVVRLIALIDCAEDGQYTFLLDATPLPLTNGLGTPLNPMALK